MYILLQRQWHPSKTAVIILRTGTFCQRRAIIFNKLCKRIQTNSFEQQLLLNSDISRLRQLDPSQSWIIHVASEN
jgi:hypothetical protein